MSVDIVACRDYVLALSSAYVKGLTRFKVGTGGTEFGRTVHSLGPLRLSRDHLPSCHALVYLNSFLRFSQTSAD